VCHLIAKWTQILHQKKPHLNHYGPLAALTIATVRYERDRVADCVWINTSSKLSTKAAEKHEAAIADSGIAPPRT
jgi:hypothetical protein